LRRRVDDEADGRGEIGRQRRRERAQRLDPARRRADDDDLVGLRHDGFYTTAYERRALKVEKLADPSQPSRTDANSPFVIGIGASAGGIHALQTFFASVDPHGGGAYAVILHLAPDRDSRLAEVLQTTTSLPVTQVTETTRIEADHVYVVPPNKSLAVVDGTFTVSKFTGLDQRRSPVDAFFRTLADTHGSRSVGVILSGTGPNGSVGLKRIKEYGGMVLAQDPAEAEYADMPRNAIATGLVDLILPASEMPATIRNYVERVRRKADAAPVGANGAENSEGIGELLTLLRIRTGHDFSNYKMPTLHRRIERRMDLRGIPTIAAYARLVRQQPEEAVSLMKELLISVTNFFRDADAWTVLEAKIIPRMFLAKGAQDQVRVWVPGCATGEEAYSVAMLLAERAAATADAPLIQIFATDLDQRAIERAREGVYSEAELADVSEKRLQRFFRRDANGFRIRQDLRELVLFATHNLIKDPPFSHLDLICCRNVLIYLNRVLQERLIETFHFALRPPGYLFLGASESPDGASDLFLRCDGDSHIYESRTATSRVVVPHVAADRQLPQVIPARLVETRAPERISPADLHQRVLEQYAPPSVIITEEHKTVHLSDRVGRYFQVRGGEPSRDLLQLARAELRPDLRSALYQAAHDRTAVDVRGVTVTIDGQPRRVDIAVKPVLREGDPARGYFVVMFHEHTETPEQTAEPVITLTSPIEPVTRQLEDELTRIKTQLRITGEQYETHVEEAKASNEELQAMNEELRSAAEELETSKEELQSVNEELTTVNQELKVKIEELGLTNNDFENFINATDIGTIFLDQMLRVKFSTPRAREVFNLLETDVGRPLSDITSKLRDNTGIHDDVRAVLDRLSNVEREVQTEDECWHLMRMLPYRTSDNRIDGVVITFQNITERRTAEMQVRQSEERLRVLIDSALEYAIFTTTEEGIIDSWNSGAQRMFGYTADEIVGANMNVLFTPEDRARGVHEHELQDAKRNGRAMDERYHVRKDGTRFYCSGVTRRLGAGGIGFAKIARDLTQQRDAADALLRAHTELETRVRSRTEELESEVHEHEAAKTAVTHVLHRLVTAQEDERARIARDLHDQMGQQLTVLRMALERAQQQPSSESAASSISQALQLTSELGHDVDFLSWQLRPTVLDELGLTAALPRFVAEWSSHVGIPAVFRGVGYEHGQLPREAEVAFYRIAQEALNNIAKHSHASRVDVVLGANDGRVTLVVEDDGLGFDLGQESVNAKGFGLSGMRERAALVGASLHIESKPDKGTSVFLTRPVESPSPSPGAASAPS
jgi:two-component system CheB/CheR fusion protein